MIEVMSQFSNCVERASIDEAYLDVTKEAEERLQAAGSGGVTIDSLPNTFVEGWAEEEEEEKKDEEADEDEKEKKAKGVLLVSVHRHV